MPVTDQQIRAIAFLAAAARPTGCRPWDESGIVANIAKVRDRSLSAVVIAVMQAAEDRNAATPGVIATNGPHWRDPASAPVAREPYDPMRVCGTCGEEQTRCRVMWSGDHEYLSVAEHRRPTETDVPRVVDALREQVAETRTPVDDKPTKPHETRPELDEVRRQLAPKPDHPTTPPPTPRPEQDDVRREVAAEDEEAA